MKKALFTLLASLAGTAVLSLVSVIALVTPALAVTPTTTNNPPVAPHSIISFPQRDFISAAGYAEGDVLTVEVLHPGSETGVGTVTGVVPQDDPSTPDFDGIVEVNHPGGECWVGATPDIRAGDRVRITNEQTGVADEITNANVTAQRPVQTAADTVEVHGTAKDKDGNPLPIDQIEQRLVVPGDQFALNGRRTLRAPGAGTGDGTVAYDAAGSTKWTATYKGLSADDVTRALGAESRGMWLGADPAAAVEATIFENGAGAIAGPSAPCTAPLEKLPPPPGSELVPPSAPSNLSATNPPDTSTVELKWTASTDNVGVTAYGIYRNGVQIVNVQNPDGSVDPPTTYTDKNLPAGSYTYTVDAQDEVGNRSSLSNEGTVTTTVNPAPTPPGALNEPPVLPHSIISFPQRDFVSAAGYDTTDKVNVYLIRNGNLISTATGLIPQDDPGTSGFDGIVEVNHPGGGCWEGTTPAIVPGDQIRLTTDAGVSDQTTTSNVTAQRPIQTASDTVVVHGTAQDKDGNPLPLDQIEQRLVSAGDLFTLNGKRTIRAAAGSDGTLAYDGANSTKWTATYKGLSADDVTRALEAESRGIWLGADPAAGNELTIFENGPAVLGGPSAPCTGTSEPAPAASLSPTKLDFGQLAPNTTSAPQTVNLTNGGTKDLKIDSVYLAGANPDSFVLDPSTCTGTIAAGASCSAKVSFRPDANAARSASLNFTDNANNDSFQSVALKGTGFDPNAPTATAPAQKLTAKSSPFTPAPISVKSPLSASTVPVELSWSGGGAFDRFELQESKNGGAYTPVTLPSAKATSLALDLQMGTFAAQPTYQYRVRSCKLDNTCSSWAEAGKFTMTPVDDSLTQSIAYSGSWSQGTVAGSYGGTVRFATQQGPKAALNKLTFRVPGNAAWISTMGPDRGKATVSVDGGTPLTIDLYSPTLKPAQEVFAINGLSANTTHTVTVQVLGQRNTASSGTRVDIDGFVALR